MILSNTKQFIWAFRKKLQAQRSIRLKCQVRKDQYVKCATWNTNMKSIWHYFDSYLCWKPNSMLPHFIEEVFDVEREKSSKHEKNKSITYFAMNISTDRSLTASHVFLHCLNSIKNNKAYYAYLILLFFIYYVCMYNWYKYEFKISVLSYKAKNQRSFELQ